MFLLSSRPRRPRRGVTLVEMLVVVALLVLMMTIIVQIFSAATGAVSAAKVYQGLDDELRHLDSVIRKDLGGVTARLNPPLDPSEDLGYFEYIENSWADTQGEDTDDCLRFTAQAPPNQPFTGRMYIYPDAATLSSLTSAQQTLLQFNQPITITSDYAEIIYFLRNGNLYRRVLLIAPDRQQAVNNALNYSTTPPTPLSNFSTNLLNTGSLQLVSWLGVNDLSARPSPTSPGGVLVPPILNTLGDLTNREHRAFSPRFGNDYSGVSGTPDGIPDDFNINTSLGTPAGDGVDDYYPTLYPGVFTGTGLLSTASGPIPVPLLNAVNLSPAANNYQIFAFPYIFPGAYSRPDPNAVGTNLGWIHSLDPTLGTFNHAPLDVGDSLLNPLQTTVTTGTPLQTWWGFPTWRETMSPNWFDPVWQVNANLGVQATGLIPFSPSSIPTATSPNFLPSANSQLLGGLAPQLFTDNAGSSSSFTGVYYNTTTTQPVLSIWQDDLLMTGVRSFDVKGYDNTVTNYVDLGNSPYNATATPLFTNNYTLGFGTATNSLTLALNVLQSLGHEGLIPPRSVDYRFDPQAETRGIFLNIGDDQTSVIRLRRTWDTWSTDYTEAPSDGYDPNTLAPYGLKTYPPGTTGTHLLNPTLGSNFLNAPIYPSYPPPYPAPLRGIQIQVRVVDPRNERVKVLTIRQDFSDKIYKKRRAGA